MNAYLRYLRKKRNTIIGLILIFGATFVYAEIKTAQEFTVERVNVFPDSVTTVGWSNIETILNQNVADTALYQDFNEINSAFVKDSAATKIDVQRAMEEAEEIDRERAAVSVDEAIDDAGNVASSSVDAASDSSLDDLVSTSTATTTPEIAETEESADNASTTTAEVSGGETVTASSTGSVDTIPVVNESVAETSVEEEVVDTDIVSEPAEDQVEAESITETVDELDQSTSEAEGEPVSWFKRVTTEFNFAQAVFQTEVPFVTETSTTSNATEDVTSSELTSDTSSTTTEESVISESPVTSASEIVATSTVAGESQVDVNTSSTSEALSDPEGVTDQSDVIATTTSSAVVNTETIESESSATSTELAATNSVNPSTSTIESCTNDCGTYSITLAGFGLPIFDENTELDAAQLRFSLAAKRKPKSVTAEPQVLEIEYSLDEGASWNIGSQYVIDDEISNSLNGGYQLVGLPDIEDPAALDDLIVRINFIGDPRSMTGLFVDSAWLELFTISAESIIDEAALEFDSGFSENLLRGDELQLSDDEVIRFNYTDGNSGETLIIKSDEVTYKGLTQATTYFNVTNTSDAADVFSVETHFPTGSGEVLALEAWNQNKPRQITVAEYRPYVYHCEAGWEAFDTTLNFTVETESAESVLIEDVVPTNGETEEIASSTAEVSETDVVPVIETEVLESDATTTVETLVVNEQELLQATFEIASTTLTASSTATTTVAAASQYTCRDTNIVRACDEVNGEGTACQLNQVKVQEAQKTAYKGGWDIVTFKAGPAPSSRGVGDRLAQFVGLAPDRKEVPDRFEVRTHTDQEFRIAPGETRYFKMEIAFEAFTTGEYWIEAIGNREYGLLDPFWSSQWQYRIPILIDNTDGTTDLTEQQIFFELDSSLSDFWTNVQEDGSDVRFIQEVTEGNLFAESAPTFDNTFSPNWNGRVALTIPASSITSTVSQFPVYVDLADLGADFWAGVAADGADIRVTQADGKTEVPYELVAIDTGSETGELHFRATLSDASDNVFHIYYDNPGAAAYASDSEFGSDNVWTNGYLAVYHFEEDAVGTGTPVFIPIQPLMLMTVMTSIRQTMRVGTLVVVSSLVIQSATTCFCLK